MWLAITEQYSPALLTRDRQLINIIPHITKSLGAIAFSPYNDFFRNELSEKQPRAYFKEKDNETATLKFDIPKIQFPEGFSLKANTKIYKTLREFWRQFEEEPAKIS